jgi:hypothetical protein
MGTHELTVYPYHLNFLKDFPELSNWLNCSGFTILHSHMDFRMNVVYTFWDDHTAEAEAGGTSDAKNSLMIAYCQSCKTVEVFHRAMITCADTEKTLVAELDRRVRSVPDMAKTDTADEVETSDGLPTAADIEKWLEEYNRQ